MKIVIIAILFVLSAHLGLSQIKIGFPTPDISLPGINDSIMKLSSLKGKVVLIDFWASWCGPCRASNPRIMRIYKKYKGQGFEVLGISLDNKKEPWLKAIRKDRINYLHVIDAAGWNSLVAGVYGVNEIPASFLLDRNGNLVAHDQEGKVLEKLIKQLLQ